MRIFLFTLLLGIGSLLIFPAGVNAAPLVPCDGINCQSCDIVKLGSNLFTWLVRIMATLCAIVIAIAGFKMVTAGGDSGAISEAREMITNVVIGFIILLSAWLIVDTIMKMFVDASFGPWNKIDCVAQPQGGGGPPPPPGDGTPTSTTACSIPATTPVTDALAQSMENGTTVLWTGTATGLQACANKFTSKTGGSVVSAFRPAAYQTHLWEVHNRWCALNLQSNTVSACSALKTSISAEMSKHGLSCSRPVGVTSNHTAGRAIDVNGIVHGSPAVLTAAAESCLNWYGGADPVHYELKSGCTCN